MASKLAAPAALLAVWLLAGIGRAEALDAGSRSLALESDELAAAIYVALANSPPVVASIVSPLVRGPSGHATSAPLPSRVTSQRSDVERVPIERLAIVQLVSRGLAVDDIVPGGLRLVPRFDAPGVKLVGRF